MINSNLIFVHGIKNTSVSAATYAGKISESLKIEASRTQIVEWHDLYHGEGPIEQLPSMAHLSSTLAPQSAVAKGFNVSLGFEYQQELEHHLSILRDCFLNRWDVIDFLESRSFSRETSENLINRSLERTFESLLADQLPMATAVWTALILVQESISELASTEHGLGGELLRLELQAHLSEKEDDLPFGTATAKSLKPMIPALWGALAANEHISSRVFGKTLPHLTRFISDIFRYLQNSGDVHKRLDQALDQAGESEIILAGHSLGGVIIADYLTQKQRKIHALVTIGSQVGFLHDLSLRFQPERILASAKTWINVFHKRDYLSSKCGHLGAGIIDIPDGSLADFPDSHSTYFFGPTLPHLSRYLSHG